MRRRRRLTVEDPGLPAPGHNLPPFEWKLNPDNVHREVGFVPNVVPPNSKTYNTCMAESAPDCDWLNYVTPNASRWKPPGSHKTRDQYNEKDAFRCRPHSEVLAHSEQLVSQKEWALVAYQAGQFAGQFAYQEFMRYFGATVLLDRPAWATKPSGMTILICP